jgi:hypothetical protein
MTTVTVELPDEVRAVIDEARGEQDVAAFVVTEAYRAARRKLARHAPRQYPAPLADELTPADHIRMAEKALTNSLDIDDFERLLYEDIARQRAERAAR